jgi:hypothetical protein
MIAIQMTSCIDALPHAATRGAAAIERADGRL